MNRTKASRDEPRNRAKSADRALRVLEYLASVPDGSTFSEIARELEFPKSSAHELLGVMTDHSFVEFNSDTKQYRLGIRTWELGQSFVAHRDLTTEARPVISSISRSLDETVQVAVLDGYEEVYLDRVDSSQPLRVQAVVGGRVPAHMTALGKVLLSDQRDGDILAGLKGRELREMTQYTITDAKELVKELQWVRAHGFAIDDEEYAIGLRCVAVPVRDHSGSTVASISVAVPVSRGRAQELTDALLGLVKGATEISRRLGCDTALLGLPHAVEPSALKGLIGSRLRQERETQKSA